MPKRKREYRLATNENLKEWFGEPLIEFQKQLDLLAWFLDSILSSVIGWSSDLSHLVVIFSNGPRWPPYPNMTKCLCIWNAPQVNWSCLLEMASTIHDKIIPCWEEQGSELDGYILCFFWEDECLILPDRDLLKKGGAYFRNHDEWEDKYPYILYDDILAAWFADTEDTPRTKLLPIRNRWPDMGRIFDCELSTLIDQL